MEQFSVNTKFDPSDFKNFKKLISDAIIAKGQKVIDDSKGNQKITFKEGVTVGPPNDAQIKEIFDHLRTMGDKDPKTINITLPIQA